MHLHRKSMQPMRKTSVVLHTVQHLKERLFGHSGVANPRDTYGYHCGLRLALTKNPSLFNVPPSTQHCTRRRS